MKGVGRTSQPLCPYESLSRAVLFFTRGPWSRREACRAFTLWSLYEIG